jgi:hypothetical protein
MHISAYIFTLFYVCTVRHFLRGDEGICLYSGLLTHILRGDEGICWYSGLLERELERVRGLELALVLG